MGTCKYCGNSSQHISGVIEVCRSCILEVDWSIMKDYLLNIHKQVRLIANLPAFPPKTSDDNTKYKCDLCINQCALGEDDISYCGLRDMKKNQENKLPFPTQSKAYMHGYLDATPTNCCNAWFCPAGSYNGYPEYSNYHGPELGTYSYAAFLYGCSFNCLFCQNSSHKYFSYSNLFDAEDLANSIFKNERITCICYFGGTPEPQLPFTIHLAKLILDKIKRNKDERKFRVCWEWNGSGNSDLIEKCMKIALKTGGNIKFDLKSYHERLNYALCGVSNKKTLENFKFLAEKYFGTRNDLYEISACTLLVPEYVNKEEVRLISKYISEINNKIPYSLLVFHPDYQMQDLPITPKKQALDCLKIAKKYLVNVHLGNQFLLRF
jgi:pyruvate formate lyase activating enzyme